MIARRLPPTLIGWLGRLQFKLPALAPLINWAGAGMRSGESVIRYGVGEGLRFDPAGGHPGYALGTSDPDEQALLADLLKPNDVFYDIGANVGFFTTLAARLVGPAGHVYGFEPFPRSAAIARANAARNGFDDVTIVQAAVSDKPGEAEFLTPANQGTVVYRLKNGNEDAAPGESIRVAVVAIDDLINQGQLRPPSVVTIDAEGAELSILVGMTHTLRTHRPTIMCEVHWISLRGLKTTLNLLLGPSAYDLSRIGGGELPHPDSLERYHVLIVPKR
jgi:FkbM family methyltransferase